MAQPPKKKFSRRIIAAIIIGDLILVAVVVAYFFGDWGGSREQAAAPPPPPPAVEAEVEAVAAAPLTEDRVIPAEGYPERILGSATAPVVIYEYSSLTCPHCASFHTDVLPRLKTEFIETGKVRLVYRDFPLGDLAATAALVARCAPEEAYFSLLGRLFETQRTWAQSENPGGYLLSYAAEAGMDQEAVTACLENSTLLDQIADVQTQANQTYGIASTPSFVINGEVHRGNIGYAAFVEALNAAGVE